MFPAEARKKKRWGRYLEITKGKGSPSEGVSLRELQSRTVKCSVVRGEPVDQVRGCDHDRINQAVRASQSPGPDTRHSPMSSSSPAVSQAVRAHNAALTTLYFHHRETVLHIQSTLRTQILPNVLDELALANSAHHCAQEWLLDERKSSSARYLLKQRVTHHPFF